MNPEPSIEGNAQHNTADFFRDLPDMLPGVVYQARFAPDGSARVEYMSEAARWLLECDPAEVMRDVRVFRRLIHPDDRALFNGSIEEQRRKTGSWQLQYRLQLPSGRVRWLSSHASVIALPDGGALWRGFMTDCTEQHEAAAAFARSAKMLSRTQQVAGMGTWGLEFVAPGVSDDTRDKLWWSDETYRLLGLEPGSVSPTWDFFYSLVHPEDLDRLRWTTDLAIARGQDYKVEFRVTRADGTRRYFSEAVEILFDAQKCPVGLVGTLLDITARVNAEHELDAERERLALATRAGNIGTWDYDMRAGTIRWNDVMYEIHGVTRDEYRPDPEGNYRFLAPGERERIRREFDECLASGRDHYTVEAHLVLPDGSPRLTRSQAVVLRNPDGAPVRMVGIEMDVTEARRTEAAMARAREIAEAAARAKSEFLATMSHEIRTPMNGVLGYTELLKSTPLNAEQRDYLDTIESSGEHLLAIINDVLEVSRIEAGGLRVQIAPFDPRGCVRGVFEMLRPVAEAKNLAYSCHVDPALPAGMESDRGRLAQVLTNILGNAIKFTDAGHVQLDVGARPGANGGDWNWTFRVTDTGPGIPERALPHIFQPFYQADGSASRRHGGTGLGLAISRQLAELMSGSLTAGNRDSGGSEFTLTIRAPAPGQLASPGPAADGLTGLNGTRVLVVEDNPVNRRLCGLQLKRIGCDADFAVSGAEAVEMAAARRFDAVLMDMQLPGLDGCGATREIRRIEKESGGARLPIIAMTANARAEDRQRCLEAGMDDYLSKPLRQEALLAMLSRWIRKP